MSAAARALTGLHAIQCPVGYHPFTAADGQTECLSLPHQVTTFFTGFFVVLIVAGIFGLICQVKIIRKAGYSGWYVLTGFVPVLGLVMFLIFVFKKWPIQERLERAERGVGRGYPPPPSTAGPGGGTGGGAGGGAGGGPGPAPQWGPPAGPSGSFVPQPAVATPGAVAVAVAPGAAAAGAVPGAGSNVIFCSWCGKERAVDAQAIHYCGSMERPAVYCMHCGSSLNGASNCASCGTPSSKISR